jgi:hypothetical protein
MSGYGRVLEMDAEAREKSKANEARILASERNAVVRYLRRAAAEYESAYTAAIIAGLALNIQQGEHRMEKQIMSTMFGHAAFERLEGKVDHLCYLLSRARAHVASLNDAEHMMDGLDIVNGEPVGRRAVQPSDGLLAEIDAAISDHRRTLPR